MVATNPGKVNLVVAYEFEDDWLDSHGNNDLTPFNSPTFVTGKVGEAADFELDNNQYAEIADNSDLSMGDIDMSGVVWTRLESLVDNIGVFGKWNNANEYVLAYLSSRFQWIVQNSSSTQNAAIANNFGAPGTGTFYFIYFYYNASTNQLGISVNNGSINTTSHSGGIRDGNSKFSVGDYQAGEGSTQYDGEVDQLFIYKNRILTADEVEWLYNSGNGRSYSALGITVDLSGSMSFSGSVVSKPKMPLAGAITFSGSVLRKLFVSLAGIFTPSGAVASAKKMFISLAGAITFSGSVSTMYKLLLEGAISFVGGFRKLFSGDLVYKVLRRRKRDTTLNRLERNTTLTREKRDYTLVWNRKKDDQP